MPDPAALSPETVSALGNVKGVRHGFFNRVGGVSGGIYKGLNCGPGSSDNPDHIGQNRALVADWFNTGPDRLFGVSQTHSAIVRPITQDSLASDKPEGDGLVTDMPGAILSVLTADCTPVLFADPEAKVIGAAHAGWRGAAGGILDAVTEAMTGLGATPDNMIAAIGPTISVANYEVGPDFIDQVIAADPATEAFIVNQDDWPKPHFDLPSYAKARLKRLGIGSVEQLPDACSYASPQRYYSWRYNQHQGLKDYGRMVAAICMTE